MKATPARRQVAMAVLLGLAMLGAAVRYWAPNPSLARDIGTLMLVLWLPAVGNLIAWLVRQGASHRQRRAGFDGKARFTPHFAATLVRVEEQAALISSLARDADRCTLVIGQEGFSARTQEPLAALLAVGSAPATSQVELLKPALALPRLLPGTHFHLVVGTTAVAQGTVDAAPAG